MPYIAPVPITHSSVAGNVPNTTDELATGALAVNLADGALYTKDYAGAIVRIEGDGGNATIASAATLDLGGVMAGVVDVTGTTTITAIGLRVGQTRTVRFTGVLTLTHGASLVLPGSASITTAAGDFATFRGYAGGLVRCTYYSAASIAAQLHAASSKVTPVDADEVALVDSATAFSLKRLTWANLKAALASWINGGTIPGNFTNIVSGDSVQTVNSVQIKKDGSNTIGGGPMVDIRNVSGSQVWVQQLSAGGDLDFWNLSGEWSKKFTFSSSSGATGSGALVFGSSPTLSAPNLGTPTTLIATNATGTASSLTAGNSQNLGGVLPSGYALASHAHQHTHTVVVGGTTYTTSSAL